MVDAATSPPLMSSRLALGAPPTSGQGTTFRRAEPGRTTNFGRYQSRPTVGYASGTGRVRSHPSHRRVTPFTLELSSVAVRGLISGGWGGARTPRRPHGGSRGRPARHAQRRRDTAAVPRKPLTAREVGAVLRERINRQRARAADVGRWVSDSCAGLSGSGCLLNMAVAGSVPVGVLS